MESFNRALAAFEYASAAFDEMIIRERVKIVMSQRKRESLSRERNLGKHDQAVSAARIRVYITELHNSI